MPPSAHQVFSATTVRSVFSKAQGGHLTAMELKLIPREVLFANPAHAMPRIAPDGNRLAYLAPRDGVLNVWVRTIGYGDDRAVTEDTGRGIRNYQWAESADRILYLQDTDGDENWRLYDVHLDTGERRLLTPFDGVQVQVLATSRELPNFVAIAMNKENPQHHDVYRVALDDGALTRTGENPGNYTAWVVDAQLAPRAAVAAHPDGSTELLVRDANDQPWRRLAFWSPDDSLASAPLGFTTDGEHLYLVDMADANASRLVKVEVASGERKVLLEDPQYDVTDPQCDPRTREVFMAAFLKARREWVAIDPAVSGDLKAVQQIAHGDLLFCNADRDNRYWVLGLEADERSLAYFLYERASKSELHLFDYLPQLNDYTLARMEPISFKARDGLTIHGYLTLPPEPEQSALPLVLNVHGGPWHRDSWGYHAEAQWLANRGYACLQVNFRGSTGYGKAFLNASNREWGGRMHDDLVDAVEWAIKRGVADRSRIAIYGGSYGGYAALVGATFTPDLFCCAVDVVGPSNLLTWITSIPPYWSAFRNMLYARIGNPETEADFLKSRSPLFLADRIKIPMLIAQGANDPRVVQAESEQIVAALKRNRIPHEYMLFEDEGHGFARPENRFKFYAAAERFLAEHLGGRYET